MWMSRVTAIGDVRIFKSQKKTTKSSKKGKGKRAKDSSKSESKSASSSKQSPSSAGYGNAALGLNKVNVKGYRSGDVRIFKSRKNTKSSKKGKGKRAKDSSKSESKSACKILKRVAIIGGV
jgi:hypothetical protein